MWCKGRYIFYNSQEMNELSASARRERLVSYPLIWGLFRAKKICKLLIFSYLYHILDVILRFFIKKVR